MSIAYVELNVQIRGVKGESIDHLRDVVSRALGKYVDAGAIHVDVERHTSASVCIDCDQQRHVDLPHGETEGAQD